MKFFTAITKFIGVVMLSKIAIGVIVSKVYETNHKQSTGLMASHNYPSKPK